MGSYAGETEANQANELRLGIHTVGCLALLAIIGTSIVGGLWCHFTATENGLTHLQVFDTVIKSILGN